MPRSTRKGGDVTYRVQNKVRDGSDPKLGPGVLLPLRRRRARVEVTLLHDGIAARGMNTLEDLFGFNFVALRNELFPMYLPTSPGGRRHAPKLRQVIDAAQAKLYRDAFVRGGCYAVSLYDEALTYRRRQLRTSRRRKEPKLPRLPRQRIGKNGNLVEWSEMNRRVGKALLGLSKGWRPSASEPP